MDTIEINGVTYAKKQGSKAKKGTGKLLALAMMMAYIPQYAGGGGARRRPEVDIVSEFKLIQEKKSKFSRNDRDWIERQFHRNFTKIEP